MSARSESLIREYVRAFMLPGTNRASREDYRAAARPDFDDDERDLVKRVRCPVLAIWGEFGKMHAIFDVLAPWKDKADALERHPLPCRHSFRRKLREELLYDLRRFLKG